MTKFLLLVLFPAITLVYTSLTGQQPQPPVGITTTQPPLPAPITPEFLWSLGRVQINGISPDRATLLYSVTRTDLPRDSNYTHFFLLPTSGPGVGVQVDLPANAQSVRFHPTGAYLLYLKNDTLFSFSLSVKRIEKVSDFQIQSYNLSGDGRTLVFTRRVKYEQMVRDIYPDLTKSKALIFNHLNYRHLDDGYDDGFRANVFVANWQPGQMLPSGKNIMENQAYHAHHISCSSNGRYILYDSKKVSPNEQTLGTNTDVYLYDTQSGQTRNLSEGMQGYDQDAVFSPDDARIAWNSMQTPGYETDRNRIMVFDFSVNNTSEITNGFDFNANNPQWIDRNNLVFATEQGGTTQLYSVNLTGQIKPITSGSHTVDQFFPADNAVFFTQSSYSQPAEVYKTALADGKTTQYTSVNTASMRAVKLGMYEERFTRAFDGKNLQSWVIYPPDFDPTRKYPVVLYCQGGPQSPLTSAWSVRWSMQLIAAQGYIVVAPNRRGTFGFGRTWTEQVSQNWGDKPMKDLLSAIDDFSKEPYVDKTRLAAVGGSFGGYSVFWLAGNHKKRFKCFISHCGLFNLESFYGVTDELFFANRDMGEPYWNHTNNPTYKKYSPHLYVKNWDTPILIFQGALDYRVPEGEGLQALQAAQLRGIESKLVYFPDEGHSVRKPQNSVLWQREFLGWLAVHLQ